MQRKWYVSVVQVSTVRAVVLALMSSLLTAVVAVTTTTPAQAIAAQGNMMSTDLYTNCALDGSGNVYCWGQNASGQIKIPESFPVGETLTMMALPAGVVAREIQVGPSAACVLSATGDVYCHGKSPFFADPTSETITTKVALPGGSPALSYGIGQSSQCVVLASGQVLCKGDNEYGSLGKSRVDDPYYGFFRGDTETVALPAGESATSVSVESAFDESRLSGTGDSVCAVTRSGRVYCWGSNFGRQVGNGSVTETFTATPQLVAIADSATAVAGGSNFNCALTKLGRVYCWGQNSSGSLGQGNKTSSPTPLLVPLPETFTAAILDAGENHVCAADRMTVYCWGSPDIQVTGAYVDESLNWSPRINTLYPMNSGERIIGLGLGIRQTCVMTTTRTRCNGVNRYNSLLSGNPEIQMPNPIEIGGFSEAARSCSDVTSATGQNYELWDLSYCDFSKVPGATFESATAYGVNLQYAKAAGLNFRNALLGNAFFENSDLVSADFRRAGIGGVRFNNANLTSAILDTATASSANFLGANLSGVSVNTTILSGAQVDRGAGPGIVGTPAAMPSERTLVSGTFRSTDVSYLALRVGAGTADTPTITTNAGGIGVLIADPVANSVDSVTVTVTKSNPGQKIFFNGVESASGIKSETLTVGDNAIQIRVLADDGTSERITSLIVPRQADCSAALAPGVNLFGCDLRSRNVAGANLTSANLGRATMSGMNLETLTAPGANLGNANLSGANLHQVSFLNAMLLGANFESATLTQAGMAGVLAENANFTNANLHQVSFLNAMLLGANFESATLTQAGMAGVLAENANFTNANLSQANLTNAFLQSAVLTNATLTSAVLNNALVTNANFSGAVVSVGAGPVSGSAIFAMSDYLRIVSGRFRSGALMSLSVNATMTPAFAVDTRDYYVSLPNTTTALQFTVTPADSATVLKLEFNLMTGSPNAPFSAVETVAVPVGTTTFRVDNMVEGSGGGVILTNRWNVHVTRAAAPAPSSGSGGGGGGGGAPAPAPTVSPETSTATPKVETSTVTPKADTATATVGSATGGSASTGSGSVNETPTVTAPLVTTEVRRLVFTYTLRQTVLNKAQLQRLRSQLTTTTTAVSVLGYVTRSKSTSADRAKSLQRANRAASQIVRTSSMLKPTTRGAGGAKAKGCEKANNNCVVVLITRTK